MEKRPLAFWEVVVAAFLGGMIYDQVRDFHSPLDLGWFAIPALIAGMGLVFAAVLIVGRVMEWREMHQLDRNELDEARAHGFESYAEYMAVHAIGEDVRESWARKAAREKRKW